MKFFLKQSLFVKTLIILALLLLIFDIILIIIWLYQHFHNPAILQPPPAKGSMH